MKILLFHTKSDNVLLKKLIKSIKNLLPDDNIIIFHDLKGMSESLKKMVYGSDLIILIAKNNLELDGILSLKEKLVDHQLIIVLPDDEKDISSKASQLYPRFIGYLDATYLNVIAVLEKMVRNSKENNSNDH